MLQDLRFALRMIATHPWFSAAVIVTLGLGIGINTTVFTLVNAVLFKPVPIPGGEHLVSVSSQRLSRPDRFPGLSYPDFQEFRQHARSFAAFEALQNEQGVISESGNPPERYNLGRVTPGLIGMLRTPPVQGRLFSEADGRLGAPMVVLLSHHVWHSRYGGAIDAIGRTVRLNGSPATIIGVMPEGFRFPNNHDLWAPLAPTPADLEDRTRRPLRVFGMLRPGVPIEEAGAELAVVAQRLQAAYPATNEDLGVSVRTFHEAFNGGPIRTVFLTMLGAVGFVLLIACANVANLMLSRALARQREISIRAALGASRVQLVRQLLVESVVLSCLGGLLGLALATGGVHLFDLATHDVGKPYWILFTMDYTVYAYFAAVSVGSGLLFGLAPALRASRVDLNSALKDGSPSGGSSRGRLTGTLVVVQFALTVILLTGAGLMVRSFFAAQSVNRFVPADQIFTARLSLPGGPDERYHDRTARLRFYEQLLARLGGLPGVTHVGATSNLPGSGAMQHEVEIEGRPVADPQQRPRLANCVITPGYAGAIALPIQLGRDFEASDGEAGREAAIVTREFAARNFPGQDPVGRRFRLFDGPDGQPGPWLTIVGVSADLHQRGEDAGAPPLVFTPLRLYPNAGLALVVRTTGDPAALSPLVRSAVQELDQDLPLFDVRTLRQALARQTWFLVVFGSLFLTFALVALLMASIGLYAVVAQATARRTREIGIRMALGASAARILQLVLARGLVQLGLGLVLGLGGAYASTRLMRDMIGAVSPQDPTTFALVTALLVAVGLLACLLPARRAAALHPVAALRQE